MNSIVEYLYHIIQLKNWFICFAGADKKYESFKIWARWLITHMSIRPQPDGFFPTAGIKHDLQIINELVSKGCSESKAETHYRIFVDMVDHMSKKLNYDHYSYNYNSYIISNYLERDQVNKTIKIKHPKYQELDCIMSKCMYEKLKRLHSDCGLGIKRFSDYHIWKINALYNILDGASLQWSIPHKLFDFLHMEFNCDTELFASPFNCYYKKYYSLYPSDTYFGSRGNFFRAPEKDFIEGCFQINPPFIDILFSKVSECVLSYLDTADENGKKLTFIYVMPDWSEVDGYDILVESKYCNAAITINARDHYYYQANRHNYIKVFFNTKVLIMSTEPNVCPYHVKRRIIECFKNPFNH